MQKFLKNKRNIILLLVSILFIIGIGITCFLGEKRFDRQNPKQISGATQVEADAKEKSVDQTQIKEEVVTQKKDKFEGKTLIYNDKSIPMLMYHSVDKEIIKETGKLNELRVPKEMFREQLQLLKDEGYTTLTLSEVYNFMENNKGVPEKSIVITFDDGYVDNYTNAYPILKEFGFNATVFVVTDYVDKSTLYMNSEQLKEMDKNGVEIQSHTVTHPHLPQLSHEKQLEELKNSKAFLEGVLNKKVEFIAYPFGENNEDTRKIAKECGYKMAVLADGKWSNKNNGLYTLQRVYVSSLRDINNFKERISNPNFK
jgi:peptidoglycan/xylan/chitin deacetylase (PgdA/CDA1 family)